MYRVIAIVCAGLALAACSSTPDWMKAPDLNLDVFKPQPVLDTVRFESEPPGAEAKTSNGQSCRTPCALALPTEAPLTVSFTLNGYLPESDTLEPVALTGAETKMQPNPMVAQLSPAAPPPKPFKPAVKKKPVAKKKTTAKPVARAKAAAHPKGAAHPKPAAAAAPPPAPMSAQPEPQQAPSPWPAAPPPQR